MRLLSVALLATGSVYGCSCLNIGTPCSYMGTSTVVFVGRVLIDSGEGWGNRPAHVVNEEALQNVPEGLREVDIETAAGTSCYYRLREGERYVIFTGDRDKKTERFSIGGCTHTFNVRGNEHILDALRNRSKGGPPRLVGTVQRSTGRFGHEAGIPGVSVAIEADGTRQEAVTDGFGRYEFRGLGPGQYRIELAKDGFVADADFNRRWSGRMKLDEKTNVWEPDNSDRGAIFMGPSACQIWDLAMWANGRISGTIRGKDNQPLDDVTVRAFGFNEKGQRESTALRSSKTDATGVYTLDRLPEGDYEVGVNADTYIDDDPYPPTLYSAAKGRLRGG